MIFSSALTVHAKHAHKHIDESREFFKIGKVFNELFSEVPVEHVSCIFDIVARQQNKTFACDINNGRNFIDGYYNSDFAAKLHGAEMLRVVDRVWIIFISF